MKTKILKIAACVLMVMLLGTAVKAADPLKRTPSPDKALLEKFTMLCRQVGRAEGNYTLGGSINITDKANPASQMDHISFLFCKQGNEFYYRLGKTATINEDGVYIYVDYPAKRLMVSAQKQVLYDAGMKQFADMGATIKAENYKLISKVNGEEQTISLINDHHISCHEFSILFDKRSMKVKGLLIRLTNIRYPLNKDMDRIINVSISKWDHTANLKNYLIKDNVVKKVNGSWVAVNEYKDYRLINM